MVEVLMAPSPPALVTLNAAAAYMSCSRRHLERLVAAGQIPTVRLGRAVRVAVADLDGYINDLRRDGR
jgi:excisionase family DNA binding protein